MKKVLFLLSIFALLLFPKPAFCGIIDQISGSQVAVEKLTGRGDSYDVNFSGWVGSLKFDFKNKAIFISEFSNIDGKILVVNGVYTISKVEERDSSVEFECVDTNAITEGIEWRGKVWLSDAGKIKVEIVQKQSPRKWVNLSEYGMKFLKTNGIERIDLGV